MIYFDHAASTPVAPEVLRAMKPYFSEKYGNPGSLHSFGQEAMAAVDRARERLASALAADFRQIVFTGSATESNNLSLRGTVAAWRRARTNPDDNKPRVIISAVEHESILETARDMERSGVEIIILPVGKNGLVQPAVLRSALNENTVLVSVMYANNETGAIQSLIKLSGAIADFRVAEDAYPLFHTDAAQALQFLDCRPSALGVDFMTFSAHKIYGPKGIGALYIRDGKYLLPAVTGGGQEFGLRSGTENTPLIAGFAAAVEYIEKDKRKNTQRIAGLRDRFVKGLTKICPKARLNSSKNGLPHIANVWLPGYSAEEMLVRLDLAGLAVAAGSACTARSLRPSHVLSAMGLGEGRARESLRVSFGRTNTLAEVDRLLSELKKALTA